MRSAGCVVNDFADRNFDGAVERTKNRPFAKGLVSKIEALLLTVMLCLMAALCLVQLNRFTWLMSLPALFLAITYPFTKRFFPLPQFYLGLAFSFGIPMAFAAVQGRDDLKIGIKTSAITFGHHDITASMLCHFWFTVLMAVLGIKIGATWPYWLILPITVYWQYQQYVVIRTRNRQLCFQTFLANNRIGLAWFCGLVCHYFWLFLVSKLF